MDGGRGREEGEVNSRSSFHTFFVHLHGGWMELNVKRLPTFRTYYTVALEMLERISMCALALPYVLLAPRTIQ